MSSGSEAYQLSAVIQGHTADVRALSVLSDTQILSASRDASAKRWEKMQGSNDWQESEHYADGQGKFISAVSAVNYDGQTYYALGSAAGKISLHAANSGNRALDDLVGHTKNVCALDRGVDAEGRNVLISGSWDQSAIVWKALKPAFRITSHLQAVWDVKCVGNDRYLTASADKIIQLHSDTGELLQTYAGHTDCVRSLALTTDGKGFWSAGNDGNVIFWSFDSPNPIQTYQGHTSFVYSVVALPDGTGCVTGGEDGTARIWQNHQLIQSIAHPTISVWAVDVLPNGDIVSGASDATIRVWSKATERRASLEQREKLERDLRTRALNKSQVGDVNMTDLPGREALGRPGRSEGQVIMIKSGDKVEAYQWSSASTTWQQIGEVTDAIGTGRKQLYQGVEYDYVFDVDIAENMPALKLPYNVTDNMYTVAEKFLLRNDLPTSYTDQIVKFLETNTQGATIGTGSSSDPFTGSSSYKALGNEAGSSSNQYRDPFTGGGAYTAGPANHDITATETQSANDSVNPSSASSTKSFQPIRSPQYFAAINIEPIKRKISELVPQLPTQSESDIRLAQICDRLGSTRTPGNDVPVSQTDVAYLMQVAHDWPADKRFPVLDIIRYLCASTSTMAEYTTGHEVSIIDLLLDCCDWAAAWQASRTRETNTMLVMRAVANLSATLSGRRVMAEVRTQELLGYLASQHSFKTLNKNTRIAMATIALNLSVLALEGSLPREHGPAILQFILNIMSNETEDGEVSYRAMIAFENVLSVGELCGAISVGDIQIAKELSNALALKLGEPRLQEAAKAIALL